MARKAKAHLKLNLAMVRKGSKKDFYRYIDSKWKTRESGGPLLNGNVDLVT